MSVLSSWTYLQVLSVMTYALGLSMLGERFILCFVYMGVAFILTFNMKIK